MKSVIEKYYFAAYALGQRRQDIFSRRTAVQCGVCDSICDFGHLRKDARQGENSLL